jgi:WD40 repeat protein
MVGMSVAFSPDGSFLAVGYGHRMNDDPTNGALGTRLGRLTLINLTSGEEWSPERTTDSAITGLAFCPDRNRQLLAVAGKRGIEVWDWKARRFIKRSPDHGGNLLCDSVAFSPSGPRIALGGADNTIRLWEPETDKEPRTLHGHRGYVLSVAFSPDGTLLTSVSEDRSVRLWEVATGRELANFRGHTAHVFAVAFHPDGRRILSGGIDGVVKVWDIMQSRPVIYRGHSGWVTGAAFGPVGGLVATQSDMWSVFHGCYPDAFTEELRKTMKIDTKTWDPDTGEEVRPTATPGTEPAVGSFRGRFNDLPATSPDGRRVLKVIPYDLREGAPTDREVRVIDSASGRVLLTLVGHTDSISCVAFSPDGRRIATASDDRTVKLWDSETGQEVLTLRDHTAGVNCVAFSPDGHRLVSGSIDRTARIWDARPLKPETTQAGNGP